MNTQNIQQFLSDLGRNNSLAWMKQNVKEYSNAKDIFITLVQEFVMRIAEVDNSIPYLRAGT